MHTIRLPCPFLPFSHLPSGITVFYTSGCFLKSQEVSKASQSHLLNSIFLSHRGKTLFLLFCISSLESTGRLDITPVLQFIVGFIIGRMYPITVELRYARIVLSSSPAKQTGPASPNTQPSGKYRHEKLPVVIKFHVSAFLKKCCVFLQVREKLPYNLAASSLTSAPFSSQLITYSKFPYHFLYAPPLLYGNHFWSNSLRSLFFL